MNALQTGAAAAAAGGYTEVFTLPNTKPVVDTKSQVEYISRASGYSASVTIMGPQAAVKGAEGKDLAEMYDMGVPAVIVVQRWYPSAAIFRTAESAAIC